MKRLYITDLDGTLFDSNGCLSDASAEIINGCIDNGANFTFATARTAASALKLTEKINFNVPCILMNGVSIYDTREKKYINSEYISHVSAVKTAEAFEQCGVVPFMYKIEDDRLFAMYRSFENKQMHEFFLLRRDTYDKPFVKCDDFAAETGDSTVYFTTLGEYEKLAMVKSIIDKIQGVSCTFYRDVYNKEMWFLEAFSDRARKSNGVKFLKKHYEIDHVTCFGDNLNDLPMFYVSDVKVAVENAKPEVKSVADEVIGDNNSDSVALWMKTNYNR